MIAPAGAAPLLVAAVVPVLEATLGPLVESAVVPFLQAVADSAAVAGDTVATVGETLPAAADSLSTAAETGAGEAAENGEGLAVVGGIVEREGLPAILRVVLYLVVGIPLLLALGRGLRRWIARRGNPQQAMITGKLVFYFGLSLIVVTILWELGFSLGPLLGAAGILGIAIGFASQTSISNIISGFFLMAEQPFRVDDVIQIGTTVGRVLSIDMMSVKLRTFDNRFIRIPNESIVKTEVTTITRFPIRRLDVAVGVAYKEDVGRVREVLLDVAHRNPLCLIDPEPLVIFEGYGESAVNFRFAVWAVRENFLALKNSIQEEVKERFDEEGIEIPFPHRTLYAGLESEPFPVRVVRTEEEQEPADPADL